MVYTVDHFVSKTLDTYTKNENFKVLVPPTNDRFAVVKTVYNSKGLDEQAARWTRSVVWDTKANVPVSVSPPKAEMTTFPLGGWNVIQDHVDGVMINAFLVKGVEGVKLATRSYLGASNRYNGLKDTFAELFDDIISADQLASIVGPLGDEYARFTSFVLVHPSVYNVTPNADKLVYVVHQGTVATDGTVSLEENVEGWTAAAQALSPKTLSIPSFPTEDSLKGFVDAKMKAFGWKWQGFSAKTADGKRWRYTTDAYRKARSLRGNESDSVERFLRLRRARAVQHYLKYYVEDKDVFWDLETKMRVITQDVFNEYCLKNKAKSKTLKEVPPAYRVHVYGLHSLFIEVLKPQGLTLQKDNVIEYFNTQPLERMAHLLRVGGGSDTTRPVKKDVKEESNSMVQTFSISADEISRHCAITVDQVEDFMAATSVEVV